MKVILSHNIPTLGLVGEVVSVKDGYGRNFLLPRNLAVIADERNKSALDHQRRLLEKQKNKLLHEAKSSAELIEKTSVTVTKQVGEEEKIFGSVTTAELEELLLLEGIKVDKKAIKILDDIKKVGVYSAQVQLHPEVAAKFKVWVVAQ